MDRIKKLMFALNYGKNTMLCKTGLREPRPWNVAVNPTLSCNLRCMQCSIWKGSLTQELDTNSWKEIINDIIGWLGPCYITITGGEPLLRRETTLEIIMLASKRGIMTNLITNGSCLDRELLSGLDAAGLDTLSVSLDGKAETHDTLRGRRGLHKRITSAIEIIHENKINTRIIINTTIMKPNLDEIADLIVWSRMNRTSIKFQALVQNFGEKNDLSWFLRSPLWPADTRKTVSVIDRIISMKTNGFPVINSIKQLAALREYYINPVKTCSNLVCNAGQNISINPDGEVRICPAMEQAGSLYENHARAIWNSGRSRHIRRSIMECRHSCKILNCNFNDGLRGKLERLF